MDQALQAAIEAVISQTYASAAPPQTEGLYAVWRRIGGEPMEYLDNAEPQVSHALVQVEVWGGDVLQVKEGIHQLAGSLRGHAELVIRPNAGFRDGYDADMKLFSASQDFDVWG
ncbi:hypothetical protein [Comamonas sp. GB3 AK4-5]|uniref:hypothetical protein n=1 Tax=Comamonas sp. GB3 AK4-5 TaxID=3231487 RepID=UPI00351DF965